MKTTYEQIENIIRSELNKETRFFEIHNKIAELIREKWEGRRLNVRFKKQVQEFFPDAIVYYEPYSKVSLWGGSVKDIAPGFEQRIIFWLDIRGSFDKFHADNPSTGSGAMERNRVRIIQLSCPAILKTIAEAINDSVEAKDRMEFLLGDLPDNYAIGRAAGLRIN
jgi:hypothetical protein